jgi:hypothetical protein
MEDGFDDSIHFLPFSQVSFTLHEIGIPGNGKYTTDHAGLHEKKIS